MTTEIKLEKELATYARERHTFLHQEGRFILIAGDDVLGVFDTYQDALTAGYAARRLEPFLVKQISAVEGVANFSRHLKAA